MNRHTRIIADIRRALWLGASLLCASALADGADARRDQLKAAYLFNFVKFIEWPASASEGVLTVCFVGANGVHDAFNNGIEHKKAGSRSIASRDMPGVQDVAGCSVLYVDATSLPAVAGALPTGPTPAVLTISDARKFTQEGGIIELFTERNRLRFNINIDNAHKKGLRISSSLLELAASVEKGDQS